MSGEYIALPIQPMKLAHSLTLVKPIPSLLSIHLSFRLKLNQDFASCTYFLESMCSQLRLFPQNENMLPPLRIGLYLGI